MKLLTTFALLTAAAIARGGLATTQEVIDSKIDLWGEAALKQPGGPTYEFFEKLLPPIRYVDADFRCYPIVMSAPGARVKGRLVSDGSCINALARQPNWANEMGTPVRVLVGKQREVFGQDPRRLNGPKLRDGYLPIVSLKYEQDGGIYGEEVFASVDEKLAAQGAVIIKLGFPAADRGRLELRIQQETQTQLKSAGGVVRDANGRALVAFDDNWEFNGFRASLTSKEKHPQTAFVVVFTKGEEGSAFGGAGSAKKIEEELEVRSTQPATSASPIDEPWYQRQRDLAIKRWGEIVAQGMQIQVPEKIVNDAWRALIVQQHQILAGEQMNYSAGNQYARQYANESGDSIRSLKLFGHEEVARRALVPLFEYRRPGIELHDAGFKLEDLADYYFITRDNKVIDQMRSLWQREIDLILSARDKTTGLLPRERYCSDIPTPVISLNNNANCWRGLRDMGLVLEDMGEREQATKLAEVSAEYLRTILAAMNKWTDRSVDPPFIPVALEGEEPAHDPITATRLGSYWNLVIPCVLWSGIFPPDAPQATAIIRRIQEKGGLCLGLTRVQSARGVWVNPQNIDDLYGIRYVLALLWRDEVDRALVSFYGKLAQGFTRDTFIDGESTGIESLDEFGRQVALPPNSTANARFLMQLRYMLVQDWDTDGDGKIETLRLGYGVPRAWLEDGKKIIVERAPTAFGEVSFSITSEVKARKVRVQVQLPEREVPKRVLLRIRGHRIEKSNVGQVTNDVIELTGLKGKVVVEAELSD